MCPAGSIIVSQHKFYQLYDLQKKKQDTKDLLSSSFFQNKFIIDNKGESIHFTEIV